MKDCDTRKQKRMLKQSLRAREEQEKNYETKFSKLIKSHFKTDV